MAYSKVNVLHIGIGNRPSTFLLRRLLALQRKKINCIVSGTTINKEFKILRESKLSLSLNKVLILFNLLLSPRKWSSYIRLINLFTQFSLREKIVISLRYINVLDAKVDIIHFHWIAHVPDLIWTKKIINAPIIASVRGSMVTVYPYKYKNYEDKLNAAFRLADRLHFVSKGLMDFCLERFQLDPTKCIVNYNGIDTEKFKPIEDRLHEDKHEKIRLVTVGALIWRKNLQDLLKVVKQSSYLNDIELYIIGEGEERFILEFMITKYQLENQVKLMGQFSEEQIIEYLQHADIYLSTSYAEGLSNAVMEAATCGLPVIAFDCEGMNEIIQPNVSGFIIEHGRTDLFVQALDQLIENSSMRREMGQAARQHVVNIFDEDSQVEAMIKEYQNLIDTFHSSNESVH